MWIRLLGGVATRLPVKPAANRLISLYGWRLASTSSSSSESTANSTVSSTSSSNLSTGVPSRELQWLDKSAFVEIPQAWVTSLATVEEQRLGIVDLHPDIFRVAPRLDLLHRNITWQMNYRQIQMTKQLSKAEMPGGGRKPWPQKRMGRHHAGSIRTHHFIHGGICHGVRGPKTWFYMLPDAVRLQGLCVALTIKATQSDLVIVNSFDALPEDVSAQYLHDLAETRNFGYSALLVDDADEVSAALAEACHDMKTWTPMPVYGLNCFSILKHETLILTQRALERIEERILFHKHRADSLQKKFKYMDWKEKLMQEAEKEDHADLKWSPLL